MGSRDEPGGERTLVLIKPDAVTRGYVGQIIQRFEEASLTVVAVKMRWLNRDFVRRQYPDLEARLGAEALRRCERLMTRAPVVAVVLEGADAVAKSRRLVGPSFPQPAPKGSIRGDFLYDATVDGQTVRTSTNVVHASSTADEATYEIDLWFDREELFTYPTNPSRIGA